MRTFPVGFLGCLLALIYWFAWIIVSTFPIMLLWNWLMPQLFKLPEINLLQVIGLSCLTGVLFRSSSSSENYQ